MKKCSDCNVEMIDNCVIEGQHPFEIGVDGRVDISLNVHTGEHQTIRDMKVIKFQPTKELKEAVR